MNNTNTLTLKNAIRNVPDFPKKGIQFKDITTLISQPVLFNQLLDLLVNYYSNKGITQVCGIESRGFIFGGALASRLGAGFIPIRKPGKLPYKRLSESYELEYGTDSIEIHQDALSANDVVLIHDDLLATGGTAMAAYNLVKHFGVKACYLNFIIELDFLKGRDKLPADIDLNTIIHF